MAEQAQALSVEQRVAAMKARLESHRSRQREERERLGLARQKARDLCCSVLGQLGCLRGLPVRSGEGQSRPCTVSARELGSPPTLDVGTGVRFTFHADPALPDAPAWVEHDGDRVTEDVAVDLAVAWVEANLVLDGPAEDDIPF